MVGGHRPALQCLLRFLTVNPHDPLRQLREQLFRRVEERPAAGKVGNALLLLQKIQDDVLRLHKIHAVFHRIFVGQYEQARSVVRYRHVRRLSTRI
jgi:hypothetical protein